MGSDLASSPRFGEAVGLHSAHHCPHNNDWHMNARPSHCKAWGIVISLCVLALFSLRLRFSSGLGYERAECGATLMEKRQVNAVLLRSTENGGAESGSDGTISIFSCMHIPPLPALKLTMHHHISISTNTQISAAVLAIE